MLSVLDIVAQMALNIAVTAWVVRRDERQIAPELLERAWNGASFWIAVVVFGPLCIPVHFARTRRSLSGLGIGIAWMVAAIAVTALVATALYEALDALGVR